jgi:RNA polymerase sigma-70 factor (ECF subfamily)
MRGDAETFERHRGHLTGLAYRMLGSVAEAEDVVQDAFLRWHRSAGAVEHPRAFLSTVVARLCLDRLKAARHRRETYVGPWLPEPLIDDPAQTAEPAGALARDVSVALMLALERLSPLERAAFLLHDVFDLGFDEIAAALGRSEVACRQLASRARANVQAARPRFPVDPAEQARLAEAFFTASRSGDAAALRDLLAAAATLHTDGGGRKRAALNVITGAERIARFFMGLARKGRARAPLWSKQLRVNGLPGIATVEHDGTVQTIALEIAAGRITAIYVMRNPDKLRHLAGIVPSA